MVFRAIYLLLIALLSALTFYVRSLPGVMPSELGTLAQDVPLEPELGSETLSDLLRRGDDAVRGEDFVEAEQIYARVVEATAAVSTGRAWALVGLGRVAKHRGMIYLALSRYREARDVFVALGDRRGESVVLHNLGAAYLSVGGLELARSHYEMALDARTNNAELAITLTHLATLDDMALQHALAVQNFVQALALRRTNRAEPAEQQLRGMASILDRLGSALSYLEPDACPSAPCRELAARAYHSALAIADRLENSRDWVHSTSNLGWLALEDCDPSGEGRESERRPPKCREAADFFAQALARLESLEHSDDLEAVLSTLSSRALRLAGELDAAETMARRGLEAVERLRVEDIESRQLRTTFLSRHQPLFEELVTVLATRHHEDPGAGHALAALAVAERARGRDLLDRLSLAGSPRDEGTSGAGITTPLAELNTLENQRLALLDELECSRFEDPGRVEPLLDTIAEIEAVQLELLSTERVARGETSSVLPPAPALAAIRRRLDSKTALLVYKLAGEASFLWWIDDERFELFELPPNKDLEPRVQALHRDLAANDRWRSHARREEEKETASWLADALLGSVAVRLSGPEAPERLVVLPDGNLHGLPFAALPHPADGHPLILRHELAVLPSLAVGQALGARESARAARASGPRRVFLVADAVYSANDPRLEGRAVRETLCIPPAPLPGSAEEAAAIRGLVPPGLYGEHLGFDARSETLIAGAMAGSEIVHLAVHGVLNGARPELSHLLFSRFDPAGHAVPSRVFTHQLDDLPLTAELVVVSACDSGRGKIVRGEGVVGLTQALLAAGASRAVVSLWPVGDRATAELMKRFYQGLLRDGLPPSTALASAQRQLREDDEFAAPFYWAGFLLVGDWHWRANNPAELVFSPGEPRTLY